MNKILESNAMDLIKEIYEDPSRRKFILHLISAFVCNEPANYETMDTRAGNKCCILNVELMPSNMDIPSPDYVPIYGVMSAKSDKYISMEAYSALRKFVKSMINAKDPNISKFEKYITKDKIKKPKSKNEAPKEKVFKESRATGEDIQAII